MNFHVMQPGSSVATSLMPGEAVPKHAAVLSITGRDFRVEPIRLKTVRPFVIKEIVLSDESAVKKYAKKENNRPDLTRYLIGVVDDLIEQAKAEWLEIQDDEDQDEEIEVPKPLVRIRVEYSAPDGGHFDCENPQRFSNRFVGRVANVSDVVQFHRKKVGAVRKAQNGAELPEESVLAQLSIDSVKVEKLVREFLTAQSLTILPQNSFGDAVSQFVDKDDKHAMEMFVTESLSNQIKHLMKLDQNDDEDIANAMDEHKSTLEEYFAAGYLKKARKAKLKPKPDNWDSDMDGEWGDQPGAIVLSDIEVGVDDVEVASLAPTKSAPKGRGKVTATKTAVSKKAPPAKGGRGKEKVVEEESEEENNDVMMVDPEEDEDELFVKPAPVPRGGKKEARGAKSTSPIKRTPARTAAAAARQTKLNFSQPASQTSTIHRKGKGAIDVSDDEISDDDAFEPPPPATKLARSRR